MTDLVSRPVAALGALLAATGAGLLGWGLAQSVVTPEPLDLPDSDRAREATETFTREHVFVTDDGRALVSVAQEAELEAAAAVADPAVYVIVGDMSHVAGLRGAHPAMEAIAHQKAGRAVYLVWEAPTRGIVWDQGLYVSDAVEQSFTGDPTKHLLEMIEQVDTSADIRVRDASPEYGRSGGVALGIFGGLSAGLVGALIARFILRRNRA